MSGWPKSDLITGSKGRKVTQKCMLSSIGRAVLVVGAFASTPATFADDTGTEARTDSVVRSVCSNSGMVFNEAVSTLGQFDALVIGETHGTNEVPRDFLALICRSLVLEKKIQVGLEIPSDAVDAARLARLVRNGHRAKDILARSGFWRLSRDGRSSVSSARMVQYLLELEEAGFIRVVGFDMRVTGQEPFGDTASDHLLGDSELKTKTSRLLILLTGHGHADFATGSNSLSNSLANRGLSVLQLEYTHSGGTAWVCMSGKCGKTEIPPRGHCTTSDTAEIEVKSFDANRFYAIHCVGSITYSSPALEKWRP